MHNSTFEKVFSNVIKNINNLLKNIFADLEYTMRYWTFLCISAAKSGTNVTNVGIYLLSYLYFLLSICKYFLQEYKKIDFVSK